MSTSPNKQRGVSTLIMILAVGAALAASLYGGYSHMVASGKSQNTSSARTQARALAEDALTASAEYFNQLYCGSPYGVCANGDAGALSPTNLPAGTVLFGQNSGPGFVQATVVSNSFPTSGRIVIDALGRTATGASTIRGYLHAATIYTSLPPNSPFADILAGNNTFLGNVKTNTGTAVLAVTGNFTLGGNATLSGSAEATGTITGCTEGATCTSNVPAGTIVTPSIDAYTLPSEANAVLSVDASGAPQVTFQNDASLTPPGTTLLSALPSTSTALCAGGGGGCIAPPTAHNGQWTIKGTPTPGVLFFYGDVDVAAQAIGLAPRNGTPTPGYASILATGNVTIETNNDIVAYGQMPNVCNQAVVPTNVCPSGPTTANNGEGSGPVANVAVLSGGSVSYPYEGPGVVFDNGTASTGVPAINDLTETDASNEIEPSGTVNGYICSGSTSGVGAACPSGTTTTNILTGGVVDLKGSSDLTGVVAASESLIAIGTGTITGMVDTMNANNVSSSQVGSSTNDINGNLTINYAPGVSGATNFGGNSGTPELAFVPLWQRYLN